MGDLPAKWVIHTVGPVYKGGTSGEAEALASAYRRSLETASANGIRSIAFPSISTGAFGYPVEEAATIALSLVANYLAEHPDIEVVRFVLFSESDLAIYRAVLGGATLAFCGPKFRHLLVRSLSCAQQSKPLPDQCVSSVRCGKINNRGGTLSLLGRSNVFLIACKSEATLHNYTLL